MTITGLKYPQRIGCIYKILFNAHRSTASFDSCLKIAIPIRKSGLRLPCGVNYQSRLLLEYIKTKDLSVN